MTDSRKNRAFFLLIFFSLITVGWSSSLPSDWNGNWEGSMGSGSQRLRVAFVLKDKLGEYHNIDDGIHGEPMAIGWDGEKLRAQTAGGGSLELSRFGEGQTLVGSFHQGQGTDSQLSLTCTKESFPVTLRRGDDFLKPRVLMKGPYRYGPPKELTDGWKTEDLRREKADLPGIETVIRNILDSHYPYVHSLILVKKGKLVLEEYFYGYGPNDPHPIQSITKNVFSLLFGIGEKQGLFLTSQKLYGSFPEYRSLPGWDARKDQITLGMLLDMTSGLGCDDFEDSKDCSWGMVQSPDWLSYSLALPQSADPGSGFAYCGACLTPLATLLERQSGMKLPDFAQKYLFDPLGIPAPAWWEGPKGMHVPAFGISLTPRGMAKLGWLVLKKGKWNGRQVVPSSWIAESTKPWVPNTKTGKQAGYGYLWWVRDITWHGKKLRSLDAWGVGGQHIFIVPDLDLVCVLTGGNYRDGGLANNSFKIFHEVLEAFK